MRQTWTCRSTDGYAKGKLYLCASVQEGEGDCGSVRYRLQSHFLRSVFSRCSIGVKNPCPLRNEYENQTHLQFWCLDHALCPQQCRALPGQAHWNGWSFWTKIIHLFLKSKSGFWLRLAWELESTSPNVPPEAHKRGLAGSRCQCTLNKQIGKICFVLLTRSDPNYLWIYTGGVD